MNPNDLLGAMGNPMELMRKAQEMQDSMRRMQEEMGRRTATADAGGGLVTATANGRLEIVKVRIEKSKVDVNDLELLEDVIAAACAAAQVKAAAMSQEAMRRAAADAGVPAGLLPGM